MRRMTLIVMTASIIAAGIGIVAMLAHLSANPKRDSNDKPAIAAVSPIEIMREHGKNLPPAKTVDPF